MPKTRTLATRLRAARILMRNQRDALFDCHQLNGKIHRPDIQRELDRFDDALQALAEAIKREAGR